MAEMKKCPFCGGKAELVDVNMGHGAYGAAVQCEECGCRTHAFCARLDWCANEKAIEAWNRRAEDGIL